MDGASEGTRIGMILGAIVCPADGAAEGAELDAIALLERRLFHVFVVLVGAMLFFDPTTTAITRREGSVLECFAPQLPNHGDQLLSIVIAHQSPCVQDPNQALLVDLNRFEISVVGRVQVQPFGIGRTQGRGASPTSGAPTSRGARHGHWDWCLAWGVGQ
jgi:hypothetical protein